MKILGVDPSLRNFGLVRADVDIATMRITVEGAMLVRTDTDKAAKKVVRKNSDDIRRATLLVNGLRDECSKVAMAICEVPVGSQSARAMASYGICIGVLASCSVPLIQVTPMEVKMVSVGRKTASKKEMIEWAAKMHPEAPWLWRKLKGERVLMNDNEHLADALAAIYAGLETEQFNMAMMLTRAVA